MRKVVFLDRDGVINNDTGHYYIYKPEDFKLNAEILESLQFIVEKGYDIVIITNQGGIARGTYAKADVDNVHGNMLKMFKRVGVEPLAVYYCPHHNKFESCLCRKPLGLMIKKAIARFDLDSDNSFMIGDNEKDVEAANNAGIKGYKINKNTSILPLLKQLLDG